MSGELRGHVIAARNVLLGVSNFIILHLPSNWRVLRGKSPVEVDGSKRYGEVLWVTSGSVDHTLFNKESEQSFHLLIRIRRGSKPGKLKVSRVLKSGSIRVGPHDATYTLGEVKRGFLKKTVLKTLLITFYCDATDRTMSLSFMGLRDEGNLQSFLDLIPQSRCH
ncbi:MAG: hypothetical protein ACE5GD_02620 [Candidatus Geothermarchaeales archaeon]